MARIKKLAVFASGNGTNFQRIAEYFRENPTIEVTCLLTDRPQAFAAERAEKLAIPHYAIFPKDFPTKVAYEEKICQVLIELDIDLVVLAGYMRIIGKTCLQAFPNRILNIHPSLLPAYPGKQGILDAYQAGAQETGVTVHLVDEGIDTGPILGQKAFKLEHEMSLAEVTKRVHELEYSLYPVLIEKYVENFEKKGSSKHETSID